MRVVDWFFAMPDEASSYLLVTNVADDPARTQGLAGLTIRFTVKFEEVSLAVGGTSGDGNNAEDEGPTPAEIEQPILIEFHDAEGQFQILSEAPACRIWLQVRSGQGEALWVAGDLIAPLTPGI